MELYFDNIPEAEVIEHLPNYADEDASKLDNMLAAIGKAADKIPLIGGFVASAITAIGALTKGRTYRTGQYQLAERFMYHIMGQDIHSNQTVPDEIVPVAPVFFTSMFGVYIDSVERLDALEKSAQDYKSELLLIAFNEAGISLIAEAKKQGENLSPIAMLDSRSAASKKIIAGWYSANFSEMPLYSDAAIDRAVLLKQTYYRESTRLWDISYFYQYPLVAPIPNPFEPVLSRVMYTGDIPGGGKAVNGQITVGSSLITSDKYIAEHPTLSGAQETINNVVLAAKNNPMVIFIIVGAILLIIILIFALKGRK